MEAVILMGLPASGKSSYARDKLYRSHVRINLDMLRTRKRESRLLEACLLAKQRFVIDNTNPSRENRAVYIEAAQRHKFAVVGYYFESTLKDCLRRNTRREKLDRVPDFAIHKICERLELPALDEGFDRLFHVSLGDGKYIVKKWSTAFGKA